MANILNTINVDGTTYNSEEYAEMNKVVKKNDEMGKDAFLQLLVAQMKYQDPLDPQDNSSFVAELAQFSALEQMTNVADNLEALSDVVNNMDTSVLAGQMSHMIGMSVDWKVSTGQFDDDGNEIEEDRTGTIKGLNLNGETPTVTVQSGPTTYKLELGDIERIYDPEDDETDTTGTTTTTPVDTGINVSSSNRAALLGQLGNLIGMTLEWDQPTNLYDENNEQVLIPMRGTVRGVNLDGDEPALIAQVGTDTYRVSLNNVVNVHFGLEEAPASEDEEDVGDIVEAVETVEE